MTPRERAGRRGPGSRPFAGGPDFHKEEEQMIARKSASWAAAAVAVAATLAVTHAQAQQPRVNWKMQSAFGSNLPHLGPPGHRFQKDIEDMTDGRFVVKFHEPGALVPTLECFDAASKGSVDACWTTPGFHAGKYPALA